ncbi:DinB family protein [Ascidiimonas sp. W6]|uniref:DinB family protein n=1 Tax=Ascidiimonas meishanensis TaxID=3128903 RepID=UPI0030EEBC90
MKKYLFFILLTPLYASAQDTPISAFLIKWENSKNYLLEIAEAMPEEFYDYKPSERQMSFEEQLLHIQSNMNWLGSTYFKQKKVSKKTEYFTKETLIVYLRESFKAIEEVVKNIPDEALKEQVEFFAGKKSKLQILNLLQDHVTHHRGQLVVYLNLKNIKPPRYSGW